MWQQQKANAQLEKKKTLRWTHILSAVLWLFEHIQLQKYLPYKTEE